LNSTEAGKAQRVERERQGVERERKRGRKIAFYRWSGWSGLNSKSNSAVLQPWRLERQMAAIISLRVRDTSEIAHKNK